MRVFVDTNVLVDFVCRREGCFEQAKRLFALGYIGKIQLLTLSLSVVNAVYIGRKHGSCVIRERLKSLSQFISIVDLQGKVAVGALTSDWEDYEDATQEQSAILAGADCIVTRNVKDFARSSLPIVTPEELMAQLKE